MSGTTIRFTPWLETLNVRANPSGRGAMTGENLTGSIAVVSEVQPTEAGPVGGVWVGGVGDGGRGGLGGEF